MTTKVKKDLVDNNARKLEGHKVSNALTAHDMHYDPATRKYYHVVIEYSLDKNEATVVKKEDVGGNQAIALQAISNTFVNKMMKLGKRKKG